MSSQYTENTKIAFGPQLQLHARIYQNCKHLISQNCPNPPRLTVLFRDTTAAEQLSLQCNPFWSLFEASGFCAFVSCLCLCFALFLSAGEWHTTSQIIFFMLSLSAGDGSAHMQRATMQAFCAERTTYTEQKEKLQGYIGRKEKLKREFCLICFHCFPALFPKSGRSRLSKVKEGAVRGRRPAGRARLYESTLYLQACVYLREEEERGKGNVRINSREARDFDNFVFHC